MAAGYDSPGLLESALSGLGTVGTYADKYTGGRALRGALAGKPRELASFLPGSDVLGLTDEHDATSGRNLTDLYGITNRGATNFGSNAAGFLADMALSPANLAGGYAAFRAAPTIGRGLVAGGKALSGLDILDGLSGAARGSRSFLADELGALGPGQEIAALRAAHEAGMGSGGPHEGFYQDVLERMKGSPSKANEAIVQGPQYPGGVEKLQGKLPEQEAALPQLTSRLGSHLQEGFEHIGTGAEGHAFRQPTGEVVRVSQTSGSPVARMNTEEMLMPFLSGQTKFGRTIEHLPFVHVADDLVGDGADTKLRALFNALDAGDPQHARVGNMVASRFSKVKRAEGTDLRSLADQLDSKAINAWDVEGNRGNYGWTKDKNMVVLDPGAIEPVIPGADPHGLYRNRTGANYKDRELRKLYRFPLAGPEAGMDAAFAGSVEREAAKAGVPSMLRDYIAKLNEGPHGGIASPAMQAAYPNEYIEILNRIGQGAPNGRIDPEELSRIVNYLEPFIGSWKRKPPGGAYAATLEKLRGRPVQNRSPIFRTTDRLPQSLADALSAGPAAR